MQPTKAQIMEKILKNNPHTIKEDYLFRLDGRLEWQCEHGIGHTVYAPPYSDFMHGCDRCCRKIKPIKRWRK